MPLTLNGKYCACGRAATRRLKGRGVPDRDAEPLCDRCAWLDFGARPGTHCGWQAYETLRAISQAGYATTAELEMQGIPHHRMSRMRKSGRLQPTTVDATHENNPMLKTTSIWSY